MGIIRTAAQQSLRKYDRKQPSLPSSTKTEFDWPRLDPCRKWVTESSKAQRSPGDSRILACRKELSRDKRQVFKTGSVEYRVLEVLVD